MGTIIRSHAYAPRPSDGWEPRHLARAVMLLPPPIVRLLVCGNADRGDDGIALAAAATLLPGLSPSLSSQLEVRRCPELRTEDLTDLPAGVRALIIDAVVGPNPGEIVRIPFEEISARLTFSSHALHDLPLDVLVELAGVIRELPVEGTFLGLAGHRFGYGTALSRSARSALPTFRATIIEEMERLVGMAAAGDASLGPD